MSIAAELKTELGSIKTEAAATAAAVEKASGVMGRALRRAAEDGLKARGALEATTSSAMNLGRGLVNYLGFGSANQAVASVVGSLKEWSANRERERKATADRSSDFTSETRGLFMDTPGLRRNLDARAPNLPTDTRAAVARAYTQAGGPRSGPRALPAFARTAQAAAVADVFGIDPVALAGMMGQGFADRVDNPEDLIARLIADHGAGAGRAFEALAPAARRRMARQPATTGAWQRMTAGTELSRADRYQLEIRRRVAAKEPASETEREAALQGELRTHYTREEDNFSKQRRNMEGALFTLETRGQGDSDRAKRLRRLIAEHDAAMIETPMLRQDIERSAMPVDETNGNAAGSGNGEQNQGGGHGRMIPLRPAPVQVEITNLPQMLGSNLE